MCGANESPDADLAALTARLQANPASFQYGSGPTGPRPISRARCSCRRSGPTGVVNIRLSAQPRGRMVDLIAGRLSVSVRPLADERSGRWRSAPCGPWVFRPRCGLAALSDVPTMEDGVCRGFVSPDLEHHSRPRGDAARSCDGATAMIHEIVQSSDRMRCGLGAGFHSCPPPITPARSDAYYAEHARALVPGCAASGVRAGAGGHFCPAPMSRDSGSGNSTLCAHEFRDLLTDCWTDLVSRGTGLSGLSAMPQGLWTSWRRTFRVMLRQQLPESPCPSS